MNEDIVTQEQLEIARLARLKADNERLRATLNAKVYDVASKDEQQFMIAAQHVELSELKHRAAQRGAKRPVFKIEEYESPMQCLLSVTTTYQNAGETGLVVEPASPNSVRFRLGEELGSKKAVFFTVNRKQLENALRALL